jgi:hypothetical protein
VSKSIGWVASMMCISEVYITNLKGSFCRTQRWENQ